MILLISYTWSSISILGSFFVYLHFYSILHYLDVCFFFRFVYDSEITFAIRSLAIC